VRTTNGHLAQAVDSLRCIDGEEGEVEGTPCLPAYFHPSHSAADCRAKTLFPKEDSSGSLPSKKGQDVACKAIETCKKTGC